MVMAAGNDPNSQHFKTIKTFGFTDDEVCNVERGTSKRK